MYQYLIDYHVNLAEAKSLRQHGNIWVFWRKEGPEYRKQKFKWKASISPLGEPPRQTSKETEYNTNSGTKVYLLLRTQYVSGNLHKYCIYSNSYNIMTSVVLCVITPQLEVKEVQLSNTEWTSLAVLTGARAELGDGCLAYYLCFLSILLLIHQLGIIQIGLTRRPGQIMGGATGDCPKWHR